MSDKHLTEHRYEKLTWPEINDAVATGQICIVPCGAVEQHGPHLPLDVDMLLSTSVALGAGEQRPDKALVLPSVSYGYTGHVMDFPGTINVHYQHFIEQVLDITKSLAYHGFKKIMLLNGHGSNMPNLDLVARRCNLETDAECALCAWWSLLKVDPDFLLNWRESKYPGGIAHACELETSMYLHIKPEDVRQDLIESGDISFNNLESPYRFTDLYGKGAVEITSWTASYSDTGVLGEAAKATAEKGKAAYEEAVKHLSGFIDEWHSQPAPTRHEAHAKKPTIPMPWGQAVSLPHR
jgi:creatinine amidohydrolase